MRSAQGAPILLEAIRGGRKKREARLARAMRSIAMLLTVALAGCSAPGGNDDGDGSTSTQSGIDSDSRPFLFNLGGPAFGPVPPAFDFGDFTVRENATGAFLEAVWTCGTPSCTLDLILIDETGDEVGRARGTGSATLFVEVPPAGTYQFGVVTSDDVVAQAGGDVAMSAFYGQPMPEGFSAFNETSDLSPS